MFGKKYPAGHAIVARSKEIVVPSLDDFWNNVLLDADSWPETLSAVLVVERLEEDDEQPFCIGSKWRLRRIDASSEKMVYTLEYLVTSMSSTDRNRVITFSVVPALCPQTFLCTSTIVLEQLNETEEGIHCRLMVSFAMIPNKFSIRSFIKMRLCYKKVIQTNVLVDLEDFEEACEKRLQKPFQRC